MSRVVFLEHRCKGCMLCATVCPKKLIAKTERFNGQGYQVVAVNDDSQCTGCAACGLICPDVAIRVFASSTRTSKTGGAVSC